jgi:hypothetical protein
MTRSVSRPPTPTFVTRNATEPTAASPHREMEMWYLYWLVFPAVLRFPAA